MITTKLNAYILGGWIFGSLLVLIGISNLVFVHPVPAAGYFIASMLYFPPINAFLKIKKIIIHPVIKIIIAVIIIMFTLGVSDLGEMIDGPL